MKTDYNWRYYLENLLEAHLSIVLPNKDKEAIRKWVADLIEKL